MPNVSEIIDEMEKDGMDRIKAHAYAGRLIQIGLDAAPFRRETADAVADLQVERQRRKSG